MVIFNEASHTYINEFTREQYTSVTTLLGKYKEPFEKEKISKAVANKRGVSQKEVLDEWQRTNEESLVFGTRIHKIIENFLKDRSFFNGATPEEKLIISSFDEVCSLPAEVLSEHRVWSHEHKVAGTADIIHTEGQYFDVFDIKTNKKFNVYSAYNKFLYSPVEHLMECEFTTYSLQLSAYAYLYSLLTGRKVRKLAILYYNRANNTFSVYPIAYLKTDVINLLNYERKKTS